MDLEDAIEQFNDALWEKGSDCLCCGRFGVVHKWSMYGTAVKVLLEIYHRGGTEEFVPMSVINKALGVDLSKSVGRLKYWDFAECEIDVRRSDGGKAGLWRARSFGVTFLRGRVDVPKFKYVFDDQVLKSEGPMVNIRDVRSKRFDLREHLGD